MFFPVVSEVEFTFAATGCVDIFVSRLTAIKSSISQILLLLLLK